MVILLFITGLIISFRGLSMQRFTSLSMDTASAEYARVKRKRMTRNLLLIGGSVLLFLSLVMLLAGLFMEG